MRNQRLPELSGMPVKTFGARTSRLAASFAGGSGRRVQRAPASVNGALVSGGGELTCRQIGVGVQQVG